MKLTDEQCDEFRRLPCSFNDMVRAIYSDGYKAGMIRAVAVCMAEHDGYELMPHEKDAYIEAYQEGCVDCEQAIRAEAEKET